MDSFDYQERKNASGKFFSLFWNCLTVLTLLTAGLLGAFFVMIYMNPYSGWNLIPPPTLPPAIALPTSTPTPRLFLPPTWTPIPTETPAPSATPSNTPLPSETPYPLFTASVTPKEVLSGMPFVLNNSSPVAISSLTFHPAAGCNWMGVAGQVLNMSGAPISTGIVIQLGGELDGVKKDNTSLTGTARQYGESGYEIALTDHPVASEGALWIQLMDQAGLPMSSKVYFDTFESCEKNLIIVNFKQVR